MTPEETAETERLKSQLKLCEEHATTMAKDFDTSLSVVQTCRDHWKVSFGHERENVIRLRGEVYNLHNSLRYKCECPDCLLVRQKGRETEAEKLRDEGRNSVILLRCTECLTVPQQNSNEFSGGECGGCIAKERDALRRDVANRIQREIRTEDEAKTYRKLLSGDAQIIGELQGWLNDVRDALGKEHYVHDADLAMNVAGIKSVMLTAIEMVREQKKESL